jgi:prepilin-type N-terminal cleavage/methylation domain-containing protein
MVNGPLNKGFTLLEVVMTIFVFSLGILALLQAINAMTRAENNASKRMLAVALAMQELEEIKSLESYADIDNYASIRTGLGVEFDDFDREVLVSGDPKLVEIVVYWGSADEEQSLRFSTLMADYGY